MKPSMKQNKRQRCKCEPPLENEYRPNDYIRCRRKWVFAGVCQTCFYGGHEHHRKAKVKI